ncbi:hypothetical protein ABFA07_015586 [Porites harrisoni]
MPFESFLTQLDCDRLQKKAVDTCSAAWRFEKQYSVIDSKMSTTSADKIVPWSESASHKVVDLPCKEESPSTISENHSNFPAAFALVEKAKKPGSSMTLMGGF